MSSSLPETYEASRARQSVASQPDKIHWDSSVSFRSSPYRQLHHQGGLMGRLRIRLVEASDLKRSYWSALALGPVKHFHLSKAHGPVSAFCTFSLSFTDVHADRLQRNARKSSNNNNNSSSSFGDDDRKPPPTLSRQPTVVSPTIPSNNSPVWDHCQFEFPLRKGALPSDGHRVSLQIRVDEDSTAIENILPGVPTGGDSRLLGMGSLDVTDLLLGQDARTGLALPTVADEWIPLSMPKKTQISAQSLQESFNYDKQDPLKPPANGMEKISAKSKESSAITTTGTAEDSPGETGWVRVLVSYEPHGMEPQTKDIVALETFARRNPDTSSCHPSIPPLAPYTVLERRGAFLLCRYIAPSDGRAACVRLHRNAVFVIERQSLVDAAHNLALLPADVWMSTPIGQAVGRTAGPLVAAGAEVMMPAMLSLKLVWVALRTTTLAGFSGFQALGSTLWNEGTSSLTMNHRNEQNPHGYARPAIDHASFQQHAATAKSLSL